MVGYAIFEFWLSNARAESLSVSFDGQFVYITNLYLRDNLNRDYCLYAALFRKIDRFTKNRIIFIIVHFLIRVRNFRIDTLIKVLNRELRIIELHTLTNLIINRFNRELRNISELHTLTNL
jgi:hypothetical protein